MLKRLKVSNLAVVEESEARFSPGFNALTGETGAGKSVLIGALELVLGARADSSTVREGAREARVEAEFEVPAPLRPAVAAVLEGAGVEFGDGLLCVRRSVSSGGTSRAWINDSSVTVGTLRAAGAAVADIHGPRDGQNVLQERFQRDALDGFGSVRGSKEMADYASAWKALCEARRRIAALEGLSPDGGEADMLRFQIDEIEAADITDEDDDIAERQAAAAHAGEIVDEANAVTEALGGDGGAEASLSIASQALCRMLRRLPSAQQWRDECDSIIVRVGELSRSVADAASRMDADPGEMERLDARLAVVSRMRRKYGADVAGALAAKKARLADIEGRDAALEEARVAEAAAAAEVARLGAAVTERRSRAASRLSKAVTRELRDLGFASAEFFVLVEASEPASHGCDRVVYRFAPNVGEGARDLADVASTGEAARVMLAIKSVLSAHDETDVLVFDEIDANVGGETGAAVGAKMRALARGHQVIAITHLPQSAAFADHHFTVSKVVSGGRTRATVSEVEGEARVDELARMLGGKRITTVVRRHAKELLSLPG